MSTSTSDSNCFFCKFTKVLVTNLIMYHSCCPRRSTQTNSLQDVTSLHLTCKTSTFSFVANWNKIQVDHRAGHCHRRARRVTVTGGPGRSLSQTSWVGHCHRRTRLVRAGHYYRPAERVIITGRLDGSLSQTRPCRSLSQTGWAGHLYCVVCW